jgi:hypothetical protein
MKGVRPEAKSLTTDSSSTSARIRKAPSTGMTRIRSGSHMPFSRTDDGGEIRHRSAGGKEPACRLRKLHPVTQPFERVRLQLHECRRRSPHSGVAVRAVGNEIRERGREHSTTGNERKISRACSVERAWNPVVEQRIKQRFERGASFRYGFPQGTTERYGIHVAANRLIGQCRNVLNDAFEHRVAKRSHLRGREVQVRGVVGAHGRELATMTRQPSRLCARQAGGERSWALICLEPQPASSRTESITTSGLSRWM